MANFCPEFAISITDYQPEPQLREHRSDSFSEAGIIQSKFVRQSFPVISL
jgi:hypothetical protein